jgi:putative flippase GtrA
MEAEIESGRRAFVRFSLGGAAFTILGPGLFWLTYPLGQFVAVAVAELIAHALRFITFRRFVFPAKNGYRVSLARYVASALPVSLAGVLAVAFLRNRLDRTMLTFSVAAISMGVGFLWSRFVYSQPVAKR